MRSVQRHRARLASILASTVLVSVVSDEAPEVLHQCILHRVSAEATATTVSLPEGAGVAQVPAALFCDAADQDGDGAVLASDALRRAQEILNLAVGGCAP